MELWTAFVLGFVGSAHCAGMCGPLALALPPTGNTRTVFLAGRMAYNLGRIITYAALGALFGLLGQAFAIAGLQRWVSLVAGAVILLGLVASRRFSLNLPLNRLVANLKSGFGVLLRQRAVSAMFGVGLLNGLLPCGLVYVACAGATASGNTVNGVAYMFAFGLGTLPMMLALSIAGQKLHLTLRFKLQKLVPASLAVVGALLVMRGLALGIPYLSPKLPAQPGAAQCCH
jgi:uncharacterized protein